jgi:hypothetical protein
MARLKIGQKPASDDMAAGVVASGGKRRFLTPERVFPA